MSPERRQASSVPDTKDWTLLQDLFAFVASQKPKGTALEIPPGVGRPYRYTLSYEDLDLLAYGYAARLNALSADEQIVAIIVPRTSGHLFAAQIGTLRAGFAYVCIDPALPDEVLRRTLEDASPIAVIYDPEQEPRVLGIESLSCQTFCTSEIHPAEAPLPDRPIPPDRLAYLIYTSGTTGKPKGVMIEHASIANLVRGDMEAFDLCASDRVAQGSSASYDSSVEETWLAFSVGATLVVMDDDTTRLGPDLVEWLRRERITVLCPPPTLLRTTGCQDPSESLPDLRLLYVGGEALTPDVADIWANGRRLVNGYGPTECTVTCVRTDITPKTPITIGKPIPGVLAFILDEAGNAVGPGEKGELCLGGVGLARGYRNSPEITAAKFEHHPTLGRIYHTGDLVLEEPDGNLSYFGRIDAQIKLRGYRIELEAIETVVAQFEGVLEAACRHQKQDGREWISVHIVPVDGAQPVDFERLRIHVEASLPIYMAPSAYVICDAIPKSVGGKIRRDALPFVAPHIEHRTSEVTVPSTELEIAIAEVFAEVLGVEDPISIRDDFFTDLGGSSLLAAKAVTLLRRSPQTSSLTVRDIYDGRTIERIASEVCPDAHHFVEAQPARETGNPPMATAIQTAVLAIELVLGSVLGAWFVLKGIPWFDRVSDFTVFLLIWPVLGAIGFVVYTPIAIFLATAVKRLLIGKYVAGRNPVWGDLYVRNWIVRQAIRLIPWRHLEGTEFACIALRALGARIGTGVHFHHSALPLSGGWDLLEIGDEAMIGQEAVLNLANLVEGQLEFGSIRIGSGAVVETRAVVAPGASLEDDATLAHLSSLSAGQRIPSGELWDGIPAQPGGQSPHFERSSVSSLSPLKFSLLLTASRALLGFLQILPLQVSFWLVYSWLDHGIQGKNNAFTATGWVDWLLISLIVSVTATPVLLGLEALTCRFIGKVKPGPIPIRSSRYVRAWIKNLLVEASGRWISGTLFWPIWLRAAGMKVGRDCEISTIIDVIPELVTIEEHVFFADGIYLGSPKMHRGWIDHQPLSISSNTFLGNHSVLPGGQSLPPDLLLGVCTVANDEIMKAGTSWFGIPPMELPRREIVSLDESLTHRPSTIRYVNRLFWEALRFLIPSVPLFTFFIWWDWLDQMSGSMTTIAGFVGGATLAGVGLSAALCLVVLAMKWILLGRVREGVHPLWSCWCSRWDFLYVAWGEWARPFLSHLEGTLLLVPYLRAMGMKIGRRVVLATGFAQVVDPDMIEIQDGATVAANYQAHTFEDRVLKIGKVVVQKGATLGRATVPLYGAVIGEQTQVAPNSVIMKHEHLLPGRRYEGAPTRPTPHLQ